LFITFFWCCHIELSTDIDSYAAGSITGLFQFTWISTDDIFNEQSPYVCSKSSHLLTFKLQYAHLTKFGFWTRLHSVGPSAEDAGNHQDIAASILLQADLRS